MIKSLSGNTAKPNDWVIFTDLDGSLLDHHTYSHRAANKTLGLLHQREIPVVFSSSKTFSEIETLRNETNNTDPFIVENGNGVFIPVNYFLKQPEHTELKHGYWVHSMSLPRDHWLSILKKAEGYFNNQFTCFSMMGEAEISRVTGLTPEAAQQANQRLFSEPVMWLSSESSKQQFISWLNSYGAQVLQGGRFLHISGHADKGAALTWLTEQFKQSTPQRAITTLALGDSDNDKAMLEHADRAVIVRNDATVAPILDHDLKVFTTHASGPKGWSEGVNHFISFDSTKQGKQYG